MPLPVDLDGDERNSVRRAGTPIGDRENGSDSDHLPDRAGQPTEKRHSSSRSERCLVPLRLRIHGRSPSQHQAYPAAIANPQAAPSMRPDDSPTDRPRGAPTDRPSPPNRPDLAALRLVEGEDLVLGHEHEWAQVEATVHDE